MTYHLAALRLRSIGERSARFNDLTINTLGPNQTPLDHVVWLRNGGGKSSLLSLFYALLLPRKYDFMGRTVQRDLTDYIDGPDTAHTVAAWHPAETGTLDGRPDRVLITGVVYEWDDLRRPGNPAKDHDRLSRHFYAFYAVPGILDLDTLPVTDTTGHPVRRTDYLALLRDRLANHPRADFVTTTRQGEWAQALTDRGLDPDLFLTQKKMNHVEGGVEDMFRFATAKEFIDFILGLTVAPHTIAAIAQNISSIADKVAKKPERVNERGFLAESVVALDRLAAAHTDLQAADTAVQAARTDAAALAAQFAATTAAARTAIAARLAEKTGHEEALRAANSKRSITNDLAYLYREHAADLRLHAAATDRDHAEQTAKDTARTEKVWQAVDRVAAYRSLAAQHADAARRAQAEAAELVPLATEHDRYAAQLKALLDTLTADATGRAAAARTTAAEARALHQTKKTDAATATGQAQAAAAEAAKLDGHLAALDEDLRAAVTSGALPAPDVDPAAHAAHLTGQRAEHQTTLAVVHQRLREDHPRQQRQLSARLSDLTGRRAELAADRQTIHEEHTRLAARAAALTAEPRVQDLLEATEDTPVDLWADGQVLLDRLANEIAAADAKIIAEAVARTDADRILKTVNATGLLPSTLDAEQIKTTLTDAGIPAETGWEHLLGLASGDRLLAALDQPTVARIGAGVVVATDHRDAAVARLTVAGETTTALVGLYTAADAHAALHDTPTEPHAPGWTGLTRGLLDGPAADAEATATRQRVADHEQTTTRLTATRENDRNLSDLIRRFAADCPPGRLAALADQITGLDAALTGIAEQIDQTQTDLDTLDEAIAADDAARETLTGQISTLDRHLSTLQTLTTKIAHRAEWQAAKTAAETRHDEASARADRLTAEAETALDHAHAADEEAAQHDRTAEAHRRANTAVQYIGDTTPTDVPAATLDLPSLQRQVEEARKAYDIPAAQSVHAATATALAHQLAARERELPADPDLRAAADTLLDTPDGQSAEGRVAALTAADTARARATEELGAARARVTEAETALAEIRAVANRPTRLLPIQPTDIAHADALAAEQTEESARLRQQITGLEEAIAAVDADVTRLDARATLFTVLRGDLTPDETSDPDETATPPATEPFPGDETAANTAKQEALTRLRAAEKRHQTQKETVTGLLKNISQIVGRYPNVTAKSRERLTYDDTTLPAAAAGLAAEFRLRIDQLDAQLAEIAKDQAIVAGELATIVREHLDMIARAERFSRLPDNLGPLAKKKLLTITFNRPSDADLHAYINRVVENQITQGVKPEGMDLLKAAIHEAVGQRGFKVKVLKPTNDLTATTEDISLLAKWSGGEKLTVCVALYCTIAKLRAVHTGNREKAGGMLVLDNPIGRASHGPLIQLQRRVAAAQGVQLIYATGVKDFDAVSLFPGVTRLDNRAGRTGSRRYIIEADDSGIRGTRVAHLDRIARRETA